MKRIQSVVTIVAVLLGVCAVVSAAQTKQPEDYWRLSIEEITARAQKGDAIAQSVLGDSYHMGNRVPKNQAEAVKWYRKAADQGDPSAQCNLGACYANGASVSKDLTQAAKWFRKAAEQGFAPGQRFLGVCYAHGDGVKKNLVEAYKWWNLAAAQGYERAIKDREWLEKQLTPEQIAEAQRLSSEFKPKSGGSGAKAAK